MNKKIIFASVALVVLAALGIVFKKFSGALPAVLPSSPASAGPIAVPGTFTIETYAKELDAPRVLAQDSNGTILVSIPAKGTVVALPDANHDGVADSTVTLLSKLKKPHGIILDCAPDCKLFVAEETRLMRYDYDAATIKATSGVKLLDLPGGGRHTTRTLLKLDSTILISVGSTCDVCHEKNPWHGSVIQIDLDGKNARLFATGLSNSVFLARHPVTGDVWATEMGRDNLGDDLPPDEINILKSGHNYGWPICYGKNIHDTQFDKNVYIRSPCQEPNQQPSYIDLPAHSAPLGIAFVPEEGWPETMWHHALVAYHGSWNRSTPTGYKIADVALDAKGNYTGVTDFASGWLTGSRAIGRPVDILVRPGGVAFVSDDKAGVVYRIIYTK